MRGIVGRREIILCAGDAEGSEEHRFSVQSGSLELECGSIVVEAAVAAAVSRVSQIADDNPNDLVATEGTTLGSSLEVYLAILGGGGLLQPHRSVTALLSRLAPRRHAHKSPTDLQVVQDADVSGAYPWRNDRVAWAVAADALLNLLPAQQRDKFARTAERVLRCSSEVDRHGPIFRGLNPISHPLGLYQGAPPAALYSILPRDVREDAGRMGECFIFAVNVVHFGLLSTLASLSKKIFLSSHPFDTWARDLRQSIMRHFFDESAGLFHAALIPSGPRYSGVQQYEIIGHSLAIITGLVDSSLARAILSRYPLCTAGVPLTWPLEYPSSSEDVHCGAMALWGLAAAKVRAGALLSRVFILSSEIFAQHFAHVETVDIVSGKSSNATPSLLSSSAYISMLLYGLFGLEIHWNPVARLRFRPLVSHRIIRHLGFGERICIRGVNIADRKLRVVIHIPRELLFEDSADSESRRLASDEKLSLPVRQGRMVVYVGRDKHSSNASTEPISALRAATQFGLPRPKRRLIPKEGGGAVSLSSDGGGAGNAMRSDSFEDDDDRDWEIEEDIEDRVLLQIDEEYINGKKKSLFSSENVDQDGFFILSQLNAVEETTWDIVMSVARETERTSTELDPQPLDETGDKVVNKVDDSGLAIVQGSNEDSDELVKVPSSSLERSRGSCIGAAVEDSKVVRGDDEEWDDTRHLQDNTDDSNTLEAAIDHQQVTEDDKEDIEEDAAHEDSEPSAAAAEVAEDKNESSPIPEAKGEVTKDFKDRIEEEDDSMGAWYVPHVANDVKQPAGVEHPSAAVDSKKIDPLQQDRDLAVSESLFVVDMHPALAAPSAPHTLKAEGHSGGVMLTWKYDAKPHQTDFRFSVFRDGVELVSLSRSFAFDDTTVLSTCANTVVYRVVAAVERAGKMFYSLPSPPLPVYTRSNKPVRHAVPTRSAGGRRIDNGGMMYYADWGNPGDLLEFAGIDLLSPGTYSVSVSYSNGYGAASSGSNCAVKRIRVFDSSGSQLPSYPEMIILPQHPGGCRVFLWSSSITVTLPHLVSDSSHKIVVKIVLDDAPRGFNMAMLETPGSTIPSTRTQANGNTATSQAAANTAAANANAQPQEGIVKKTFGLKFGKKAPPPPIGTLNISLLRLTLLSTPELPSMDVMIPDSSSVMFSASVAAPLVRSSSGSSRGKKPLTDFGQTFTVSNLATATTSSSMNSPPSAIATGFVPVVPSSSLDRNQSTKVSTTHFFSSPSYSYGDEEEIDT